MPSTQLLGHCSLLHFLRRGLNHLHITIILVAFVSLADFVIRLFLTRLEIVIVFFLVLKWRARVNARSTKQAGGACSYREISAHQIRYRRAVLLAFLVIT
jgi:hypothetical protein